ncbi:MAG: hypothetical protein L6Q73_21135, partial [Aquabacterium sp.]|nr:hypothetical protein [Aquabacterium sp.]
MIGRQHILHESNRFGGQRLFDEQIARRGARSMLHVRQQLGSQTKRQRNHGLELHHIGHVED